ncbi:hypothetical protein [Clostridium akagii]|uniref:hypothetical protein n=1 Tax=Clostridium akagii TaxID=91623 RepID=UPI003BF998B4
MARQQLTHEIFLACNTMCLAMCIAQKNLKEYIERALPNIASNVFFAAKSGTLGKAIWSLIK